MYFQVNRDALGFTFGLVISLVSGLFFGVHAVVTVDGFRIVLEFLGLSD